MKKLAAIALLLSLAGNGRAQQPHPSYPSLLWEISGNGLKKPSYLFGSMHVSNKMVFHLSDSFYTAIASCDMVSLEVDPKEWQPDMFRLDRAKDTKMAYESQTDNGYMTEGDFRLKSYQEVLKTALREEPFLVNGLLYRTNASQVNFQENTYLDLYIYQTARKLGKSATGVENYLVTERLSEESALASMKEKRERRIFPEGENQGTLLNKLQDAYRRGDLDLLDSLNELLSTSKAFNEKFMYPRNEIQANAIDSIIRHNSLFVAVGAAHLPGSQGVIERLRSKGYTLRPVKMTDQDARTREEIDKKHVPVEDRPVTTPDGFIQCRLPGAWFPNPSLYNNSWQYSDMENGSYYMLTRVHTNAATTGESPAIVKGKIDSLLYDNIPGKILQKTSIEQNGYPGFDILNKTRAGDLQRCRILVTPFEVLLFKMSGNEDYVSGKEADRFFNSIQVNGPAGADGSGLAGAKESARSWVKVAPAYGGFSASFPRAPHVAYISKAPQESQPTWQYEAAMPTGETYVLLRKNIGNTHFLEEDTLDLSLMEESLKGSASLNREFSRKFGQLDGFDCLEMLFSRKDGGRLRARAIIRGTDYYLLIASSKDPAATSKDPTGASGDPFFDSFHLLPYQYGTPSWYTDTAKHFTVRTPVSPHIEEDLRALTDVSDRYSSLLQERVLYNSAPYTQHANFRDDSTGESIQVTVTELPLYFYQKDSAKFWENEMRWTRLKGDFILAKKDFFRSGDSICGYRYTLYDTNTNRKIEGLAEIKGNNLFKLTAITDRLQGESSFIKEFFHSFTPLSSPEPDRPAGAMSLLASKSSLFFRQYYSSDSATRKRTREAADHITLEAKDLPDLEKTIARLDPHDKNYIEEKTRLILALGRVSQGPSMDSVIACLQRVYEQSEDSSAFQNAVIQSLAGIKKEASYALLKDWLLQKTPVFESDEETQELFRHIGDDTTLAASLFPDILRLTSVEDYKRPVINLLIALADSGHIRRQAYADYFGTLFVDARIMLKKQQMADNKTKTDDDEMERLIPGFSTVPWGQDQVEDESPRPGRRPRPGRLGRYALLLLPFYDRPSVPHFFEQLLQTKSLRMETAILMIRGGKAVPDSILLSLAASDETRAELYTQLEKAGRSDLFPAKYKNQEAMARAILQYSSRYEKPVTIVAAGKKWVSTPTAKGYAYFFKYKLKDETPWLMAISGLQPEKNSEVNASHFLVTMTNRKLTDDSPELEQFQKRLQQLVLSKRKSAARFFLPATALR